MVAPPEASEEEPGGLFKRDGLYYARLQRSIADEPIEIVLHGVVSEAQARAAVQALSQTFKGEIE